MSDLIYQKALYRFGAITQLQKLIEECAELIVATSHYLFRGQELCEAGLIEELADVEIMIDQAKLLVGDANVNEVKAKKITRLANMLEEKEDDPYP